MSHTTFKINPSLLVAIRVQLIVGLALVLLLNSSWVIALIIVVRAAQWEFLCDCSEEAGGGVSLKLKKFIFDKKLSQIRNSHI